MPNAGRGVFAKQVIRKGEIIERCPTLRIPPYEAASINQTLLVTYIYYLGEKKDHLTLALGYGSIYNHSYSPNALYKEAIRKNIIEFIALGDIQRGEEITVNYNQESQNEGNPLWFE